MCKCKDLGPGCLSVPFRGSYWEREERLCVELAWIFRGGGKKKAREVSLCRGLDCSGKVGGAQPSRHGCAFGCGWM